MEPVSFNSHLSLGQVQGLSAKKAAAAAPETEGAGKALESFGQLLKNHLDQVSQLEEVSDQLIQDYAVGKPVELHNVMIAESKAGLAMDLTVQLRNKAIQAYQNVWSMTI